MMADLQGYPFESAYTGDDEHGNPIFDRAIHSAAFRAFWAKYFTTGIFYDPSTNFQALAAGGLNVDVHYGEAHIRGLTILPDEANSIRLTLPNALTTGDRTDMIVLRADFTANRSATVHVLPGKSTVADLQRDDSVWELALAKVIVRRNAASVNQADITDLRLDADYCGLVTEPITRTNTQAFFAQIDAMIRQYGATWENFFTAIEAQTESQIAQNQQAWDDFYAGIEADISVLLEHATIRQDQVIGLTDDLNGIHTELNAKLDKTAQAADSAKLGGNLPSYYGTATEVSAKATTAIYTATIPSTGWTGSAAPYSIATITVSGMLATDTPVVDIVQTGTETTDSVMRDNWGKITRIVTKVDGISVYAEKIPSAAIPIQLKAVR